MTDAKIPNEIAAMKFEDALAELEKIVKELEDGKVELDGAIEKYERGAALKRHCEAKLAEAQARIEKITQNAGGIAVESANLD
ncbi:MAG: exodeoxyribonuclease VII small subunit [Alphaproteobacteria bacterium]|jgi:exodeoxyribonuclease VII small subunit|nr:exodeoxyribonuclease VII small subunit [Alphaproteobacteria bacterium]MDH5556276.1 exodeoxyribonuclease VII small subunit [Alphaproteobacteria bacterium]